ncbi:hypothetical protein BIW11_03038 [Tropilaelaps mercedesae]|uniref:Uncharacterized protein n=1 Tax=Tropilaelaps mercedesae TaxID=418985 RepID=A0A1V9XT12_9ACAR|nr:hypothetical protein BIW11_03038 [Tropilaelaps mercedesae]
MTFAPKWVSIKATSGAYQVTGVTGDAVQEIDAFSLQNDMC